MEQNSVPVFSSKSMEQSVSSDLSSTPSKRLTLLAVQNYQQVVAPGKVSWELPGILTGKEVEEFPKTSSIVWNWIPCPSG